MFLSSRKYVVKLLKCMLYYLIMKSKRKTIINKGMRKYWVRPIFDIGVQYKERAISLLMNYDNKSIKNLYFLSSRLSILQKKTQFYKFHYFFQNKFEVFFFLNYGTWWLYIQRINNGLDGTYRKQRNIHNWSDFRYAQSAIYAPWDCTLSCLIIFRIL